MSKTEHLFIGLPDYQWSALGALATVIATLVALALPFILKELEVRAKSRSLQKSNAEVVAATRSALKCLLWALDDEELGKSRGSFDLIRVAARAASRAETLRLIANYEGLSDDAVSSCIAAAQSMDQVTKAANHFADANAVRRHMNAALALGHEARTRVIDVIVGEAIKLPPNDPLPPLPQL